MVEQLLREEIKRTLQASVGFLLSRSAFRRFKSRLDYSEYGGAPLLA
jgi:glycerol-3-phosphate acyltransferase PlsX